jgi:hypothetical protein
MQSLSFFKGENSRESSYIFTLFLCEKIKKLYQTFGQYIGLLIVKDFQNLVSLSMQIQEKNLPTVLLEQKKLRMISFFPF